jgi:hypothetical protein
MSSREACVPAKLWLRRQSLGVLFMLLPVLLPALDWEALAEGSSSAQDTVLLSAMAEGDLETGLSICRGVSRRTDPSMTGIIMAIAAAHVGTNSWRSELLLRTLLQPIADVQSGIDFRRARIAANADALDDLFTRVGDWKDAQLAGALARIAPLAATFEALRAVARIGARIVDGLAKGNGLLPSQEEALALDYLDSATALGRQELAEQCAEIARLSREPILMKAARSTARILLSLP